MIIFLALGILVPVCENCYELDSTLVAGAIGMDLLLTGGIMMIIYLCAHKKTSGETPSKSVPAKGEASVTAGSTTTYDQK